MKTFVVAVNWRNCIYVLQAKCREDALSIVKERFHWNDIKQLHIAESMEDIIITAKSTGAGLAFSYTNKYPVDDSDV